MNLLKIIAIAVVTMAIFIGGAVVYIDGKEFVQRVKADRAKVMQEITKN